MLLYSFGVRDVFNFTLTLDQIQEFANTTFNEITGHFQSGDVMLEPESMFKFGQNNRFCSAEGIFDGIACQDQKMKLRFKEEQTSVLQGELYSADAQWTFETWFKVTKLLDRSTLFANYEWTALKKYGILVEVFIEDGKISCNPYARTGITWEVTMA